MADITGGTLTIPATGTLSIDPTTTGYLSTTLVNRGTLAAETTNGSGWYFNDGSVDNYGTLNLGGRYLGNNTGTTSIINRPGATLTTAGAYITVPVTLDCLLYTSRCV